MSAVGNGDRNMGRILFIIPANKKKNRENNEPTLCGNKNKLKGTLNRSTAATLKYQVSHLAMKFPGSS
jgi:hypothetical protein